MRTRVTDLLGIRHPVLLGGMASATDSRLVAAVSRAGGLGVLGAAGLPADAIEAEVAMIRQLTPSPFGINLLLWMATPERVQCVLEQQPPVLSTAWGDCSPYVEPAHEAGCLVMHMAHDVPAAVAAARAGVDVIVAQGHEGGGHVGLQSTLTLVPQVVDAVGDIPVVAAGGIADGRGLAAALALGAEGVMMGTRFLATREAPVPDGWKRSIIDAAGHDTVYSQVADLANESVWPEPAATRAIRNRFLERWLGREDELRSLGREVGRAMAEARRQDDGEEMNLMAGQAVGLIRDLPTAAEVVERIVRQAESLLAQLAAKAAGRSAPNASR